jgi:hypothetical protein
MRNFQLPDPDTEWTEDDARMALDEWRRSGTSIAAFARERGVSAPRLYWWRRRLVLEKASPATMSLVPAAIVSAGAPAAAVVVIRLPNGIAVEVASVGVSPAWIADLVAEVARSSS